MIKLSVIIPTLNRAEYLRSALESIINQTLDRRLYEIIVVDNGSTDHTKELVRELNRLYQDRIRYFYDPTPGLHIGRHVGMRASKSDILSFVDDDIIAFPHWLENVLKSFEIHPDIALLGGKNLPAYEIDPPAWYESLWEIKDFGKMEGWFALVDLGEREKEILPDYVYGCNFSIKKTMLEQCKGFHPDYMPWNLRKYCGDGETYVSEFMRENNLVAIYNPLASIYHRIPAERLSKKYLCKRAYLQAISFSYSVTRENDSKFKRFVSIIKRIRSVILSNLFHNRKKVKVHWLYYLYGLIWHQICILTDPKLLEWIKKENYFD